jgi:integrase
MTMKNMPTAAAIEQSMQSVQRMGFGGGLYLIPGKKAGLHYWRLDYTFGRKRLTLSLGVFPRVSPVRASQLASANLALVKDGINPSEARKAIMRMHGENQLHWTMRKYEALHPASFQSIATAWLNAPELSWSDKYRDKMQGRIANHLLPHIGHKLMREITPKDIYDLCSLLVTQGEVDTARRVCGICEQVFIHGMVLSHADANPCPLVLAKLPKAKTRHFAAITNPNKLAGLLRKIHGYHGTFIVICALKLLPLLMVRPGNLRTAVWDQFDLDLGWWLIPSKEMKGTEEKKLNPEPHCVPLATQAVAILKELFVKTGRTGVLFPGKTGSTHMSENTINKALQIMGFSTLNDITGHGFRAVGRTLTEEELNWDGSVADLQLDHTVKDANGRAYNRTHMLRQRREMMQEWGDYLDGLRLGEIVYDDPLEGFTPITVREKSSPDPFAQIDVTAYREVHQADSKDRIDVERKSNVPDSNLRFSIAKSISMEGGTPSLLETQPALQGGTHAQNSSCR